MNDSNYRTGVGAILINQQKKVFVGHRINSKTKTWQLPQGGIEQNEDPESALKRELYEEIGTNKFEIIAKSNRWFYYDIPNVFIPKSWQNKYVGQKQCWFLINFLGQDNDFNLAVHSQPEFDDWQWININQLLTLAIDFKKHLYTQIINEFNLDKL